MNAPEKQELYTFLCKVQDVFIDGFVRARKMPSFYDDAEIVQSAQALENANNSGCKKENDSLEKIENEIKDCSLCRLKAYRKKTVSGSGITKPRLMIIGDAPGPEENQNGLAFSGEAGELLDKMLKAIGVDRAKECFLTYLVKCAPPNGRDSAKDEQEYCAQYLERQFDVVNPDTVLILGRGTAQVLLQTKDSMQNLRATVHQYKNKKTVVSYSPSAILKDESLKRPAWEDLKLLKECLNPEKAD